MRAVTARDIIDLAFEEAAGRDFRESWYWLSFADGSLPTGQQFLGVAIVRAPGFGPAVIKARVLGINPGGWVQGFELPGGALPEDVLSQYANRLLTKADCEDFDRAIGGTGRVVRPDGSDE